MDKQLYRQEPVKKMKKEIGEMRFKNGLTKKPRMGQNTMGIVALARIKTGGGTLDSYVDIAGYAACGGEIAGDLL